MAVRTFDSIITTGAYIESLVQAEGRECSMAVTPNP